MRLFFRKTFALLSFLAIAKLLTAQVDNGTARPAEANDGTFQSSMLPRHAAGKWSLGLFGGTDINSLDVDMAYATDIKYTPLSGFTAGISASRHFTGWFSLQADLAWVQKNNRMDRDNNYLHFLYTETTSDYLSLPLTAVVSLGRTFRLCGFFGGYAGYWLSKQRRGQSLSATYLVTGVEEYTYFDEKYEFNDTKDNRFEAGLCYGAGFRCSIMKKIDLRGEIRWYYGLTNIQKEYMTNINPQYNTTRTYQIGISYWM